VDEYRIYAQVGLALAVGFLIGLQREQSAAERDASETDQGGSSPGGVRTYPLVALLGALAALLSRALGPWIIGVGFGAVFVPLAIGYARDVWGSRDRGLTTELAFFVTYLFGVLCVVEGLLPKPELQLMLVAAVAMATTALLALKKPLHGLVAQISMDDVWATLKFGVLVLIVLPLLPNQKFGPYGVFNPRTIGYMIVLIAGVGFVGYIAIRALGPGRGLGLTGLIGGLASSTAVTLAFAGRAKREPAVAGACALGTVMASTIMPGRVLVAVAVVSPTLVKSLAIPIGAMIAAGLIAAAILYFRGRAPGASAEAVKLANPFELGSAIKFGFIFAIVLLVSHGAKDLFGAAGMYAAGVLSGTTDVDAITLSMARMVKDEQVAVAAASTTVLLAVATNQLVKGGMSVGIGGWEYGRKVLFSFIAMVLAGGGGVAALWLRSGR
jgi:uncharacterized membrane protein (DUF4010 family)